MEKKFITIDGNTAASKIAYAFSEVAAIFPITPSSPMGELADAAAAKGKKNLFGETVDVVELQSEGGASGSVHGSLSAGALTTTFTASQGLMLMLPNMHKIAGEMLPTVFHVSARSLACQSLSIFGDHSDVMSTRNTGFALVAAANTQEVQDLAVISHCATVEARIPFLNFFDGFRTSHTIQKVELVDESIMKDMLNMDAIKEFKNRSLNPDRPYNKVGAENPDVYFQGRETVNKYYDECPGIVRKYMQMFKEKTGREYNLFDYVGAKDAEKIVIAMTSGCDTIEEVVNHLTKKGEKVGAIKVRLYRPFSVEDFIKAIPDSVKKIAVLDRTKEPGSIGEPLYLDVVAALKGKDIKIIGGRYGLSSKEFTPPQVKAVFDHLDDKASHGFTVGIEDDVTKLSLKPVEIDTEPKDIIRCKFWGYGSDGTVSACKSSIKIIGEHTDQFVQGYFSYDSKKSGGVTVSHLRFGKEKILSQYLLTTSDYIALHKPSYIGRYDILEGIKEGGSFVFNCPWKGQEAFEHLTEDMQKTVIDKKVKFYVIDANKIAEEVGLGKRINTVMAAIFFKISGVLPEKESIELLKKAIEKIFKKKGMDIVKMNWNAIDNASSGLEEVKYKKTDKHAENPKLIPDDAIQFAKDVVEPVMRLKGDTIPVSKMPLDGAVPLGTMKLEKRGIALKVPKWMPENCIQCGFCSFVCPHSAIRMKQIEPKSLEKKPEHFDTVKSLTKNEKDLQFRIQVYPEDCVGCENCVVECPGKAGKKALEMIPLADSRANGEDDNQKFFDSVPNNILDGAPIETLKGSQFKTPLFEFSGACGGCGETPYYKLLTQLFGDRLIIANATGCSSIYGGTFPTIPFCQDDYGNGPAWANSLFEDNAEYAFGFRLAIDANRKLLKDAIQSLLESGTTNGLKESLTKMIELWDRTDDEAKATVRSVKEKLPEALEQVYGTSEPLLKRVDELKDFLLDKSVWAVGGDGWAYDIGYGGLDHVMAMGRNVNVLVLDTEVYSNTGGQCSKASPRGAVVKFAASGKPLPKKNLGMMMTTYGNVYVSQVNLGANKQQVVKAMLEAESYPGPSIIIAYSPCIAHGIDMSKSIQEEKLAGDVGQWPLFRYDPRLTDAGKNPFVFESPPPKTPYINYLKNEIRFKSLEIQFPDRAKELFVLAEKDAKHRYALASQLAGMTMQQPAQPQQPAKPAPSPQQAPQPKPQAQQQPAHQQQQAAPQPKSTPQQAPPAAGGKYNVSIDAAKCSGCGVCPGTEPNVFAMGDDGKAHVQQSPTDSEKVKEAAAACPTQAIIVTEAGGGSQPAPKQPAPQQPAQPQQQQPQEPAPSAKPEDVKVQVESKE